MALLRSYFRLMQSELCALEERKGKYGKMKNGKMLTL